MWVTVLITIVHVIVCLFLIAVVLLQSGKAADLAGAFGGMGSQTAFGPRGAATALSRATTIAAALFMVTSLSLSVLATRNQGGASTVLDSTGQTKKKAPAKVPEAKGSESKTVVPIPGQPDVTPPTVEMPGGQKARLPAPGEPGAVSVPAGATPEQIQKLVEAEGQKLRRLEAEEAAKKKAGAEVKK